MLSQRAGNWNSMHIRLAWEIYRENLKRNADKTASSPGIGGGGIKSEILRQPSHIYPSVMPRSHEMQPFPTSAGRPPYDPSQIPSGYLGGPTSHLGK